MRPGEATEEQGVQQKRGGFVKYFVEEIGNQVRGRPTDEASLEDPPPTPTPTHTTSRQGARKRS